MTLGTYQNETFGTLNVSKGSTIDECLAQTYTSKTLIIVTAVCGSVVVVAALLITLLVKIRRRKQEKVSGQMPEGVEFKQDKVSEQTSEYSYYSTT